MMSVLFEVYTKPDKVGALGKCVYARCLEVDTSVKCSYSTIIDAMRLLYNPKFHVFKFSVTEI